MLVIDASAVLELLLTTSKSEGVREEILESGGKLAAPHLLDLEVAHALARYRAVGEVTAERGKEALRDLKQLPIARYPHEPFLDRIWELAEEVSVDDAVYCALAMELSVPILTCDPTLTLRAGQRVQVVLVEAAVPPWESLQG